jgi:hypothetical protein
MFAYDAIAQCALQHGCSTLLHLCNAAIIMTVRVLLLVLLSPIARIHLLQNRCVYQ